MSRYQHTPAEVRIRAALSQMPYGGLSNIHTISRRVGFRDGEPAPIDLDDIGAYLEAMACELKRIADYHDIGERERAQLKADVAAVRRLFGIAP